MIPPRHCPCAAVSNLAVDLRDGLRLCRLAEVLAGRPGLFDAARFPSDKRPLRLHNVGLALGELAQAGLALEVGGGLSVGGVGGAQGGRGRSAPAGCGVGRQS